MVVNWDAPGWIALRLVLNGSDLRLQAPFESFDYIFIINKYRWCSDVSMLRTITVALETLHGGLSPLFSRICQSLS